MVNNASDQNPEQDSSDVDDKNLAIEHKQKSREQVAADEVASSAKEKTSSHKVARLRNYLSKYWSYKKWTLPASLAVTLLVIFSMPVTRYKLLGLFLKEEVRLSVVDSTTNTTVSGARLQSGGMTAVTSAAGEASMKLPVGSDMLNVSKQYYKSTTEKIFVDYIKSRNSIVLHLVATGRQVPVAVMNKITNKPVADADLKVLDSEVRTDKNGKAVIVLPPGVPERSGLISASGYNSATINVQVTSQVVAANTFTLAPTGSIYFLSNLSGKIDVVKTNLDGTNRKTVLAGTGNETPGNTVLLASRDWKYLALLAQRSKTGNPELDLIDTSSDTMTNMDEGNATFTLVGWDDDRFIYRVDRTAVQNWQNGQEALKSFNAPTKTITVLAQTTASGGGPYDWVKQRISDTYILNSKVVYVTGWSASYYFFSQINSKQTTLNSVNPDGSNHTVVKTFSLSPGDQASDIYISVEPYDGPNSIVIGFSNKYY